jgi:electron transfer flavoprotein beta subunit
LRKALALKADEAFHLLDDTPHPDPLTVARVLTAGIRKVGNIDLVLLGRESGDWGEGQTGGLLAEELGWPCICFADRLEPDPGNPCAVRIRRQTDTGLEILEVTLPAVVTVTNDDRNVPRIPKTRDVMQAHRRPLTRWTRADWSGDQDRSAYSEVVELSVPRRETTCEFVTGDTPQERLAAFARRLLAAIQAE